MGRCLLTMTVIESGDPRSSGMWEVSSASSALEADAVAEGSATSTLGRAGVLLVGDCSLLVLGRSSAAVTGVSVTSSTCRGTGSADRGDEGVLVEDIEGSVAMDCSRSCATDTFTSSTLGATG